MVTRPTTTATRARLTSVAAPGFGMAAASAGPLPKAGRAAPPGSLPPLSSALAARSTGGFRPSRSLFLPRLFARSPGLSVDGSTSASHPRAGPAPVLAKTASTSTTKATLVLLGPPSAGNGTAPPEAGSLARGGTCLLPPLLFLLRGTLVELPGGLLIGRGRFVADSAALSGGGAHIFAVTTLGGRSLCFHSLSLSFALYFVSSLLTTSTLSLPRTWVLSGFVLLHLASVRSNRLSRSRFYTVVTLSSFLSPLR